MPCFVLVNLYMDRRRLTLTQDCSVSGGRSSCTPAPQKRSSEQC